MRTWIWFPLLAVLGITFSAPASGQTSPRTTPQPSSSQAQSLTLQDAEKIAVQNHPQIQAAANVAIAAQERVKQAKSVYYPTATGSATGVEAEHNSRIAAGGLNNPIIYDRYANGVTVTQLVTDFGRTHELVKSSNLRAQAEQENVVTTRADVLLAVDQAYFAVLKAQTLLTVAQETVKERQLVSDQVTTEANNKLKSGLDVSFANVDLQQAQLLLIQTENDLQASFADLSTALGYSDQRTFQLEEEPLPAEPPGDWQQMVQQALRDRPELISQRLDVGSAQSYATAERDLWMPTISAAGAAGLTPVHQDDSLAPRYAAAGFNVNIPIFNGHLFGALRGEANAEERAQEQYLRDLQNRIVRDVRTAWLNANSAYQRLSVTKELLDDAQKALDLAQARYKLGLSSIVELSQAQLNETQAEIANASAKYDYQTQIATLNYQIGATH
ncbi:MAG TPA: TolC family protein [Candidatus Limnocylindrales bacterium]|nr:TolC family protein [Candidatus Limnocylindrales bacterium]